MSGRRALALLISLTVLAFAKEPKLKLTWIQAAPGDFVLAGKWASQRIVVTGKLADGSLHDVTGQTRFKSSNSRVAAVSKAGVVTPVAGGEANIDRKSTRLNSSHLGISYAVFCLKKKKHNKNTEPKHHIDYHRSHIYYRYNRP